MKPISLQRNSDVKHEIFQPDERVSAISGRKIHCQARRDPLPRRIRCLALREPNKTWQRVLKCGGKQVYIRPHVRVDFQDVHRGGLHLRPRPFHSPVIGKMSNRLQRKHGVPTTRVSSSFSWSSLPGEIINGMAVGLGHMKAVEESGTRLPEMGVSVPPWEALP